MNKPTVDGFLDSVLTNDQPTRNPIAFTDFKRAIYRRYEHAAHLALIDDALTSVSRYAESGGREGIGQLLILAPPRNGKTVTVSRLHPIWHLGRNPDHRVILASYGAALANKNSRYARNLFGSPKYREIFNLQLAQDSHAANAWNIQGHEGGLDAVGRGGALAGSGGNVIYFDDIVKDRAEAESAVYRDSTWDWWTDVLYTRKEPGAALVGVMTRYHVDDVGGRIENHFSKDWRIIRLPAIAEADDILGRQIGDPLWPERFPLSVLRDIEATLGPYGWASLYQQRPVPQTGGLFQVENIQIVDYVPECVQVVRFYDLAVTAKVKSDYTAAVKLGITADEQPVILDLYHVQKEMPEVQEAIVQNAMMDGAAVRIRLEAEKAGIVQLQYLMRDYRMRPFSMDAVPPLGDKYTRAQPFASRVNAGRVLMVRANWNRELLDELAYFPSSAHDDIVDSLSGAYAMLDNRVDVFMETLDVTW